MASLLMAALLIGQAGNAAEPQASSWQVSTGRTGTCFITQTVVIDARPWTVQIQPSPTGASYDLIVAAAKDRLRAITPGSQSIRIAIDGQPPFDAQGRTQDTGDGRRVLRSSLSRDWVDAVGDRGTMTIAAPKVTITVAAAGLATAVATLKSCHAERLRGYGLDPAPWFAGRLAKLDDPSRFLGPDAYPAGAPPGQVSVLATFDPTGRPTRCVALASANALLATGTCAIVMSKMTATMPSGPDGRPVASYAFFELVWSRQAENPQRDASRTALNSDPGFHVGHVPECASFVPIVETRSTSCAAPVKSSVGVQASQGWW